MSDSRASTAVLDQAQLDLSLAIGQLRRRLRAEVRPSELNLSQLAALVRLDFQGPMITADLARAESMKAQSMGAVLAQLEKRGLVYREPHPDDGRQIRFHLTEQGRAMRQAHKLAKRDWLLSAVRKLEADEQGRLIGAVALIRSLVGQNAD